MKKLVALLLIITICCFVFALAACNLDNDNDNDNNKNNDLNTVALSDLPQYMANIDGANAFGILPGKSTATRSNKIREQEINREKNYFVMTTTEYDANEPLIDENGLLKVTFSRIVTENVDTEINGTKFVMAKNSQISFSSIENFTYSIYLNGQCLYESICDNDTQDINKRNGCVTLDNMTNDTLYEIHYTGIGKEEKITQDEIDGEIDKMYIMGNYTFVSFVPVGMSSRCYGIDSGISADYDSLGYCSGSERQSFVIDNTTGYIYFIENNINIDKIGEGLLSINGKVYDIDINNNDELQFIQVVKNETLNVHHFFKDKYGNKYIQNDYLDMYDKESDTVYYTKTNYILTKEGVAIHIEYTGDFNYSHMPSFSIIEKVNADLTYSPIDTTTSYQIHYTPLNGNSVHNKSNVVISHIENGFLYLYTAYNGGFVDYMRVDAVNRMMGGFYRFGDCSLNGGSWDKNCIRCAPVDYNTVLIWCDYSGTGKLYYGNVWELFDNKEDEGYYYEFDEDKLTVLLENCVFANDYWEIRFNEVVFRQTTLENTIYYKVIMSEQGVPQIVNTETYVAPNQENIILQPINK